MHVIKKTSHHLFGFTLLEVLIYVSLLSLLMVTALSVTWQLLVSMQTDEKQIVFHEESMFVFQKIDTILRDTEAIMLPSGTQASTTQLRVRTKSGSVVTVRLQAASSSVEVQRESGEPFVALTTSNVQVENLQFHHKVSPGGKTGVEVQLSLGQDVLVWERYIR